MNKKLQVFVSSTYKDLKEERQAAVQAILDAGHIPAGMELFKAGNNSQLKTIYKWIDESDVYMLILGGRYGSLEAESGKSYTQLEYEYATSKGIPVFAVVLTDSFLIKKINVSAIEDIMEQSEPVKHQQFKTLVMSKIVKMVEDCKDIKLAIHATLKDFEQDNDLVGWVRGTKGNDTYQLLEEITTLKKENQQLKDELITKASEQFGNYTFDELISTFQRKKFTLGSVLTGNNPCITNALGAFVRYFNTFVVGVTNNANDSAKSHALFFHIAPYYVSFGLLEKSNIAGTVSQRIQTTKLGLSFYSMIESKGLIKH